ncbi:MAG: hypothetical protein ACKOJH_02260 [Actinomycetota bacterium]
MRPWAGWCDPLASPAHGLLRDGSHAMPMNPRLLRPSRRLSVPGRPTITQAVEAFPIAWLPPTSDGGSPLLSYYVYIDNTLVETITAPDTTSVDFQPNRPWTK